MERAVPRSDKMGRNENGKGRWRNQGVKINKDIMGNTKIQRNSKIEKEDDPVSQKP